MTIGRESIQQPYAGAVDHYASDQRRDAVKRLWEEPVTLSVLRSAISEIPDRDKVRVLDVGCGAGEGLHLLRALEAARTGPRLGHLEYCGVDLDADLLSLARQVHHEDQSARFECADMRGELPDEPFDLYLSFGVPYSHLEPRELEEVLAGLFASVRRHRMRSVIVIDVLGRYSIEWVPRWGQRRWRYNMSFFQGGKTGDDVPMTFWDPPGLRAQIENAAARTGSHLTRVAFIDRSIMIGRHTATGQFNPALPPFRTLINHLESGGSVDPGQLRLTDPPTDAPPPIGAFFGRLQEKWNAVVDVAERLPAQSEVSGPMLARGLREVEHRTAAGLGTGHSLAAVITVDESR